MPLYRLLLYPILVVVFFEITRTTSTDFQYWIFYITIPLFFLFLINFGKINYFIVLSILLWFIINLGVSIFLGKEFLLMRSIRFVTTMILFPYIVLQIYREEFFIKLEKLFYILTIISIPLYILNVLFMQFFNSMGIIFRHITNPILAEAVNYWSAGIYVNAIVQNYAGVEIARNCGFMWEPGYFALIITLSMIIHLLVNGIKIDFKIWVYTLVMLTTFSTAGYASLFLIYAGIIIKKITLSRMVILFLTVFVFTFYIYELEFIGGKINAYTTALEANVQGYSTYYSAIKLNRFQIALYDIYRVLNYPLGYGFHDTIGFESSISVVGTNGLTGMMRMWGLPAFIFILILFYKFIHLLKSAEIISKNYVLFFIALLVVFFSQSIQYNILTYFILIFSISYNKLSNNVKI